MKASELRDLTDKALVEHISTQRRDVSRRCIAMSSRGGDKNHECCLSIFYD